MRRPAALPFVPSPFVSPPAKTQSGSPARPRIALYSHDTCGLGHMRRNLNLARTFARSFDANILMITGAREANTLSIPRGVDMLTLPSLLKAPDGSYRPRRFHFGIHDLISLRSRIIRTALESFRPDVFVVDNVPRGAMSELDDVLYHLRRETATRCILGLRDILDHPDAVAGEWRRRDNFRTIRSNYDAIWIYGDPNVYDMPAACNFPTDIRRMVSFTGYLNAQSSGLDAAPESNSDRPFHLCTVGGGQDGMHLASAFARAVPRQRQPGVILTGPFMPKEARGKLEATAAKEKRLSLKSFVPEPRLLYAGARRCVSMGGYNTICEFVSIGRPLLVVPRIRPRQEQWIRAKRMAEMGILHTIHPAELTIRDLVSWLRMAHEPDGDAGSRMDLCGLARLPQLLSRHLPAIHALHLQTSDSYVTC